MILHREFYMIHQLKDQGLNISQIARKLHLDRKTVRKYLRRDGSDPDAVRCSSRPSKLDPYRDYVLARVNAHPQLTATRLLREIRDLGYPGQVSILRDYLRDIRPSAKRRFERRFETPPGEQAQVDFACFKVRFNDQPGYWRMIWLFSMVLGHSRYLWGQFCEDQKLDSVLRMHIPAFESLGGVPRHVLYDRMKTAVIDQDANTGEAIYNRSLLSLLSHYGAFPRACRPYRAQTKGKVERIFRYVRSDFFLGSSFDNLVHLNACFTTWCNEVANVRRHATTGKIVDAAFEAERGHLTALPPMRYPALVAVERKVNNEGMVAYRGSVYSVPDGTASRIVEVQALALEIRIIDRGEVIARHPIAHCHGSRIVDPAHRKAKPIEFDAPTEGAATASRPLWFYEAVGQRLSSS